MKVVVGLGANLGSRLARLTEAVERLAREPGVEVSAVSPVYETEPVGPPQPDYLNAAVLLRTELALVELHERTRAIERALGRTRGARWAPRSIDLDLLWCDSATSVTPTLTVPHPRLLERAFALAPLVDVLGAAPAELLSALERLGGPPPRRRLFPVRTDGRGVIHR